MIQLPRLLDIVGEILFTTEIHGKYIIENNLFV